MTNLIRVRALQRRPLRIAGNIISTSGDGSVLDLDAPRVANDLRVYKSLPFGKSRFITVGDVDAGTDLGHTVPVNKAVSELTYVKGQLLWQAIELPAGETITSVAFYSATTAADATGGHQWVGLYKPSTDGLTLTQVAVTADGTTGAWAANSAKTFTFATPYKTVGGGVYYIVLLFNGTTAPTLVGRQPFNAVVANTDGPASGLYEYETLLTGANNDLRFTSSYSDAQITYTAPGAAGLESVLTTGHSVVVTLAIDVDNTTILSTAATIKATIIADAPSAAVLTPTLKVGNDGTGAVTAMTIKTLAAQTLPSIAVNGVAQTTLPTSISVGALSASNLEAFATLA